MNLNKNNAKNKNINFLIQNIIPNLAKLRKRTTKNDIRIGIRIHPYPPIRRASANKAQEGLVIV
jgi:hypothetical protein